MDKQCSGRIYHMPPAGQIDVGTNTTIPKQTNTEPGGEAINQSFQVPFRDFVGKQSLFALIFTAKLFSNNALKLCFNSPVSLDFG